MSGYTFAEHRQRFAAWAAVTAARSSKKCRFSRDHGFELIEEVGLDRYIDWDDLPAAHEFDALHNTLRDDLCTAAKIILRRENCVFSHGVAAKLINCYLKALYLSGPCSGSLSVQEREKANSLHPPIDRLLLMGLAKDDVGGRSEFWHKQYRYGWSKFDSKQYVDTIEAIREVTSDGLWRIERHWLDPKRLQRGP